MPLKDLFARFRRILSGAPPIMTYPSYAGFALASTALRDVVRITVAGTMFTEVQLAAKAIETLLQYGLGQTVGEPGDVLSQGAIANLKQATSLIPTDAQALTELQAMQARIESAPASPDGAQAIGLFTLSPAMIAWLLAKLFLIFGGK